MKHLLLASLSAFALAGCASAPAPADASAENDGVVCAREVPTGSMMFKTKCRSAEERADDRAAANVTADAVRSQANKPPGN